MAQSHPWTNVPSVDGASSTVGIIKMQELCAKVGRYIHADSRVCVLCVVMCCVCTLCKFMHVRVCSANVYTVGRQIEKMCNRQYKDGKEF